MLSAKTRESITSGVIVACIDKLLLGVLGLLGIYLVDRTMERYRASIAAEQELARQQVAASVEIVESFDALADSSRAYVENCGGQHEGVEVAQARLNARRRCDIALDRAMLFLPDSTIATGQKRLDDDDAAVDQACGTAPARPVDRRYADGRQSDRALYQQLRGELRRSFRRK